MNFEDFEIKRLAPNYEIKSFDCGDADINDFLFNDALLYLGEHLSVTYLLETEDETIAYFSVQNDKISLDEFSTGNQYNKARKNIPRTKHRTSYPAVKIGRLGVSTKFSGKGYGAAIIEYVKMLFVTNNRTGCRFLLLDAYHNRVSFYEKSGFKRLEQKKPSDKTQLMYYDLIEVFRFKNQSTEISAR